MDKERAEAFPLCLLLAEKVSTRSSRAIGASDDDGGGFSMFAPPICRRRWRDNAFRPPDPTKTAATGRTSQRAAASNQTSAMREQCKKQGRGGVA